MSNLIFFVKLSEEKKKRVMGSIYYSKVETTVDNIFKSRLGAEADRFGQKCTATWAHKK